MEEKQHIKQKLLDARSHLQKEYRVSKIGLFGSFAKGMQTDSSDVDIIVEFNGPIAWGFFDLKFFLEDLLKRKVDLLTPNSIRKQWREQILSEVEYV